MTIFDAIGHGHEPSSRVAFSGNRLDRRSEQRHDDSLTEALASPKMRAFAMQGGRALLKKHGEEFAPLHSAEELDHLKPDMENAILLGFSDDESPRIAVPVHLDLETLPDNIKAVDHRSIYMQGLLKDSLLGELAQGASLLAWASSHRHCGRCGEKTIARAGGYRRECPACKQQLFPRTDPVVIMLSIDLENDRCLLGRSPHFPQGMYSCLAGFLEPGETMEDAVRRETLEESAIRVGRVRYHASQPWPMPHTLMIGCYCEATSTDIKIDTNELEDCRWFTRPEAEAMLNRNVKGNGHSTPPPGAIAHHLIRDWLESTD